MSGPRRLAVFVSGAWIAAWYFLYSFDPYFNSEGFLLLGFMPVALVWGLSWVIGGFRSRWRPKPKPSVPATPSKSVESGASNPQMWLWVAQELFHAGGILWRTALEAEKAAFQGNKHSPLSIAQYRTAFMLFGYAVENAIKGLIVQKLVAEGQPIVKDGKIVNLDTTNHKLVRLARTDAKLTLTEEETTLLERFQAHVLWAGRYPVMKDASAFKENELVPQTAMHPPTDHPLIVAFFEKLLSKYDTKYHRIP